MKRQRSQLAAPTSIPGQCYRCPQVELKPQGKSGSTTAHSPLVSHKVTLERGGLRYVIGGDGLVRLTDEDAWGQLTAYNWDIGRQMRAHHIQHASILMVTSAVCQARFNCIASGSAAQGGHLPVLTNHPKPYEAHQSQEEEHRRSQAGQGRNL